MNKDRKGTPGKDEWENNLPIRTVQIVKLIKYMQRFCMTENNMNSTRSGLLVWFDRLQEEMALWVGS